MPGHTRRTWAWVHEIINDELAGRFISVSYCPLTGSGQNLEAIASDGKQVQYGVSGFLLNSNLVLFDLDDNTLYPQMVFTGLNGSRKGHQLKPLPVVETTWSFWKRLYPETTVPKGGTGLDRYSTRIQNGFQTDSIYLGDPYGEYKADYDDIPFPPPRGFDHRLRTKDIVLGICRNEVSKVYPLDQLPDGAVINDQLDDLYHVVLYDSTSRTAITYNRELEDEVLYFYAVEPEGDLPLEFIDDVTGSRWNMRGEAVDGPLTGARLEQVVSTNAMWFAWSGFFGDALIWRGEGIIEVDMTAVADTAIEPLPEAFVLSQNYPNPFNATTRLEYQVPRAGVVSLTIYNSLGQQVRTLVDDVTHTPGTYSIEWHGHDASRQDVSSGEYIYELKAPDSGVVKTRGMVLIR